MATGKDRQTILITGCSSGIGRALALEFHQRGHAVHATARRPDSITELADRGIVTHTLDVTDDTSVERVVAHIEAKTGGIDMLVNNAGYGAMGPAAEMPPAALQAQFDTNVFGCMRLIRAVFPGMAGRRSGCIVNIGSVSGILTTPFAGAYCATKAAVHALSDGLRLELAPFGIDVVTVQPGGIASGFGKAADAGIDANVPTDSRYQGVLAAIHARANASQDKPTTAADFARSMADGVLVDKPQAVLRIGNGSRMLPFVARWLPRRVRERILSKRFALETLAP